MATQEWGQNFEKWARINGWISPTTTLPQIQAISAAVFKHWSITEKTTVMEEIIPSNDTQPTIGPKSN